MTQAEIAQAVREASGIRDELKLGESDVAEMMERWSRLTQHIARARAEIEHAAPREEYSKLIRTALLEHINGIETSARNLMTRPPKA